MCTQQSITVGDGGSGTSTTAALDDAALVAAVAGSFCSTWELTSGDETTLLSPRPLLPEEEAVCIGEGLVERLGPTRARALALGGGPWHLLGFALSGGDRADPVQRAEAEEIVDTFMTCSQSWKLLLALSVTEGTEEISDASARCINDRLSDDDARTIFIGEIVRDYDDPSQPDATPFPELIEPLISVFDECLSSAELGQVDWG